MFWRVFFLYLVTTIALSKCQDVATASADATEVADSNSSNGTQALCPKMYIAVSVVALENPNKCPSAVATEVVESNGGDGTQVKPGSCPAVKPGQGGACAELCKSDSNCEGDLKCCSNACGGTACVKPVTQTPPPKPGVCPANKPGSVGICIVECAFDSDCSGDLKCCKNPCGGGVCTRPLGITPPPPPPPPPPKPGVCPVNKPGSVGTCIVQCASDSDCSGNRKCCKNPCGAGVCKRPLGIPPPPPPPRPIQKPGVCPMNKPSSGGFCFVDCGFDSDCSGDLKCCESPCGGGICTRPLGIMPRKPGTCPARELDFSEICVYECTNDNQCSGSLKCCPSLCGGGVCVPSVEDSRPPQKPGTCPAVKLLPNLESVICRTECFNDYECKGDLKCCSNPCGGGACVKSIESSTPKPGNCPAIEPGELGICANMCDGDSSCEGDRKCCATACGGTSCEEPEKPAPKPGSCPAVKPGQAGVCAELCKNDSSCEGDLKCCSNACGGTACVKPVKPTPKPGSCPAIKPGSVGVCADTCKTDSSCKGELKCCPNACGGTSCAKPVKKPPPYY